MSVGLNIHPQPPGPAALVLHPDSPHILKDEPRTRIWVEELPEYGPAVIKLYPHRRRAIGRARREFVGLQHLARAGLPTTPPLFWATGRAALVGRFELLATAFLADAVPLREILRSNPTACPDLNPLFRHIAAMHAVGLAHGALIPRNILVQPGPVFSIMDLPRCACFSRDIRGTRMARFDLLDLFQELLLHGAPDLRAEWLAAYGLQQNAAADLLRMAATHRSSRRLRNWLRFEFQVRALIDRIF